MLCAALISACGGSDAEPGTVGALESGELAMLCAQLDAELTRLEDDAHECTVRGVFTSASVTECAEIRDACIARGVGDPAMGIEPCRLAEAVDDGVDGCTSLDVDQLVACYEATATGLLALTCDSRPDDVEVEPCLLEIRSACPNHIPE